MAPRSARRVELPGRRLARLAADRDEVVAIDGGRAGGHGAGRPLGAIGRVAGYAVFGRDAGRDHFQQVELRGDLEQGSVVLGLPVQMAHVARHHAHAEPAGKPAAGPRPGAQRIERDQFKRADAPALAVDPRAQPALAGVKPGAGFLVAGLTEPRELLEPVHACLRALRDRPGRENAVFLIGRFDGAGAHCPHRRDGGSRVHAEFNQQPRREGAGTA